MYFVADPEYIILKYDQIRFVKLQQKYLVYLQLSGAIKAFL